MIAAEQYFGCECYCLNHISHMGFYDDECNIIYFSVKTENLFDRILPPFTLDIRDWPYNFKEYFRYHILKRIGIASSYLFASLYVRKDGVLDCFDFQNKDLSKMKELLSSLSNQETLVSRIHWLTISNDRWEIIFFIDRIDKDFPYRLGWEIQFLNRKIFGRIRYALKYIFGRHDDEQHFEINKSDAERLKGLITVVESINKDETV